jgi:hypothetical protein
MIRHLNWSAADCLLRTVKCEHVCDPEGARFVVSHISRKTSEMPRISCTQLLEKTACARFFKERRMKNPRNYIGNRGFGGTQDP